MTAEDARREVCGRSSASSASHPWHTRDGCLRPLPGHPFLIGATLPRSRPRARAFSLFFGNETP